MTTTNSGYPHDWFTYNDLNSDADDNKLTLYRTYDRITVKHSYYHNAGHRETNTSSDDYRDEEFEALQGLPPYPGTDTNCWYGYWHTVYVDFFHPTVTLHYPHYTEPGLLDPVNYTVTICRWCNGQAGDQNWVTTQLQSDHLRPWYCNRCNTNIWHQENHIATSIVQRGAQYATTQPRTEHQAVPWYSTTGERKWHSQHNRQKEWQETRHEWTKRHTLDGRVEYAHPRRYYTEPTLLPNYNPRPTWHITINCPHCRYKFAETRLSNDASTHPTCPACERPYSLTTTALTQLLNTDTDFTWPHSQHGPVREDQEDTAYDRYHLSLPLPVYQRTPWADGIKRIATQQRYFIWDNTNYMVTTPDME